MLRIRQIKTTIEDNDLKKAIAKKINIKEKDIINYQINKQSLDARKNNLMYVYEIDAQIKNEKQILKKKFKRCFNNSK